MEKAPKKSLGVTLAAIAMAASATLSSEPAVAASKAPLAGKWTAVLSGNTGCGITSMYVTITLNAAGVGTATTVGHSTGCANGTTTGNTFNIVSLGADGQGTAGLSCGVSCGWVFKIQVSADENMMLLTDVEPTNPNNTPTGVAIRQWPR